MPQAYKDVRIRNPAIDGAYLPSYPKRRSHRIFYVVGLLLISTSTLLIWLTFPGIGIERFDMPLGVATLILALTLIFAVELIRKDEEVEKRLRSELLVSRDEGKEIESELHTLEMGYRDLFNNNPVPMWIFDLQTLRFLAVNNSAVASYGYSRDELLRMTIRDLRDESENKGLDAHLASPHPELATAGIWRHRKKDGTMIEVDVVSHALKWHGRRSRLVAANDVTKRMRAERDLREMNASLESKVRERTERLNRRTRQLRRRKRELEEVNRELELFSYSASHDLKTPLFVINTFTEILLKNPGLKFDEESRGHLTKIESSCQWMASLIDSLLRFAHVAQQRPQRQDVDLSALAEEVASAYRIKEPSQPVALHIQPGMVVDADLKLMRVVLENLIGNAWKFTAKTPHPRIEVGMESHGGEEIMYVKDNGAGFDMQQADKLFRTFQRLHGESEFTGHGIGLSTVQRVVQRHGGRIWAEAEVGKGAMFSFTLGPKAERHPAPPPAIRVQHHSGREAPMS